MQSQFVDATELAKLNLRLAEAARRAPELKREVLDDLGRELLAQVNQRIGGTGKVQRWQHTHMGTGGGYVAVHPVERETDAYGWAVGAVTNAIESGHRFPTIRGRSGRIKGGKAKVEGKYMYRGVDPERAADASAARLAERLARNLEE